MKTEDNTALIQSLKLELERASNDNTCTNLSQTAAICEAKLLDSQVCICVRVCVSACLRV